MVITSRNKLLILGILFIVFTLPAMAADVNVTLYGTDKGAVQANITKYGSNVTVQIQAWNTSYVKNITVNTANASGDTIHFNISNNTAYKVYEVKINGTSFDGYQASVNGMMNFTLNLTGNKTIVISPAVNLQPGNISWVKVWKITKTTGQHVVSPETVYQNTNSTAVMVVLNTRIGVGGDLVYRVYSDATNPPTRQVDSGYLHATVGVHGKSVFWVNSGEYWRITVTASSGGGTLNLEPEPLASAGNASETI